MPKLRVVSSAPPSLESLAASLAMTPSGLPCAEGARVPGRLHGHGVGDEVGGLAAHPGDDPHQRADGRAAQQADGVAEVLHHPLPRAPDAGLDVVLGDGAALGRVVDQLADGEQPDEERDQRNAVPQVLAAHGVADEAGGLVEAHQRQQDADPAGDEPVQERALAHRGGGDQPEHHQPEDLRMAEGDHQRAHDLDQERQDHEPEQRSQQARSGRQPQRPRRLAALGHGVAVEAGGGVHRGARGVEQDGADGAAEGAGAHDAREQVDRGDGVPGEGERQQHRHGEDAAEPRHRAEDQADDAAEEQRQKDVRLGDGGQGGAESLKHDTRMSRVTASVRPALAAESGTTRPRDAGPCRVASRHGNQFLMYFLSSGAFSPTRASMSATSLLHS